MEEIVSDKPIVASVLSAMAELESVARAPEEIWFGDLALKMLLKYFPVREGSELREATLQSLAGMPLAAVSFMPKDEVWIMQRFDGELLPVKKIKFVLDSFRSERDESV